MDHSHRTPTRLRTADARALAAACLEQLGIAPVFYGVAPGNMGKIMLRLPSGDGFVKLAPSPRAHAQLAAEASAYASAPTTAGYRRPSFRLIHDCGTWSAAILEDLPMRPLSRRQALYPRPGPFEQAPGRDLPVTHLLRDAIPGKSSGHMRDYLLERWGDRRIACAPSHGDFFYGNLGRLPGGAAALFDLEYYSPLRSRHFDRFYWSIVPLCRQAVRRPPLAMALLRLVRSLAARLSPEGCDGLALMLAEHALLLDRENHLPDAEILFDAATLRTRRRQVALYERLVHRLVP